MLLTLT